MNMPRINTIIFIAGFILTGFLFIVMVSCAQKNSESTNNEKPGVTNLASEMKLPEAVFPQTTYDFQSVVEGTDIEHDFVVENHGQAPLMISDVQPDCYCAVASNPGQIPAGGKGKISVVIHTDEKGGHALKKFFKVTTSDSRASQVALVVQGKVDPLIKVSPLRVKISGFMETDLSKQVYITPQTSQLFTIKNIKASRGSKDIKWDLKPLGQEPPEKGYILTVSCDDQKKGASYELLTLQTDLANKPVLRIPIECSVFDKPEKKNTPGDK